MDIVEKLNEKINSEELQNCNIIKCSVDKVKQTGTLVLENKIDKKQKIKLKWNKELNEWK